MMSSTKELKVMPSAPRDNPHRDKPKSLLLYASGFTRSGTRRMLIVASACWSYVLHTPSRRAHLQHRRPHVHVSCCEDDEMPSFEITLRKPLGLALEERDDAVAGLVVTECVAGGSAASDGTIWPGDLLLEVCGRDVSGMDFDNTMTLLIDAPERCDLTFGRVRGKTAALRFGPDQPLVFTQPGEPIMPLAERAGFKVEYNCMQGSCGSCQAYLVDGENEDEVAGTRPTRLCTAKVPKGSQASLMPWEVVRPDSPEAKAFDKAQEEKYASKKK